MAARFTLAAVLSCCMGAAPAAAQDADESAAGEECTGLASQEAEIACLRALLKQREAAPPDDPSPTVVPPAPQERFGTDQIEPTAPFAAAATPERERRSQRLAATVIDTRRDRRGLLVMQLDNGQIWRQDESFGVPIRFDEEARTRVEISRSGFGGYRMHFPEIGRRIVVSRLR